MRQETEKPYLRHGAIRALAKLANGKTHFGSARPKAMTL
jgi:L-ribulose-5-phosphate 3-epimerase UlaE